MFKNFITSTGQLHTNTHNLFVSGQYGTFTSQRVICTQTHIPYHLTWLSLYRWAMTKTCRLDFIYLTADETWWYYFDGILLVFSASSTFASKLRKIRFFVSLRYSCYSFIHTPRIDKSFTHRNIFWSCSGLRVLNLLLFCCMLHNKHGAWVIPATIKKNVMKCWSAYNSGCVYV